jgi:hypothetical protein
MASTDISTMVDEAKQQVIATEEKVIEGEIDTKDTKARYLGKLLSRPPLPRAPPWSAGRRFPSINPETNSYSTINHRIPRPRAPRPPALHPLPRLHVSSRRAGSSSLRPS